MGFIIKRIFVAMICGTLFIGFSVVSKVNAEVNPFAVSDFDTYIKLAGGGDSGMSDHHDDYNKGSEHPEHDSHSHVGSAQTSQEYSEHDGGDSGMGDHHDDYNKGSEHPEHH